MLAEYAALDCERLAMELGVPFLDKGKSPPVEHRKALLESLAENQDDILDAIEHYWRGDTEAVARRLTGSESSGKADPLLQANSKLLAKLGHYNSATMHYAGEWYWGVDRLHYLVERLQSLGASRTDKPDPRLASIQQAMQVNLPVAPPSSASELPPLELFHSFRSPYSYLALQRVIDIADAFGLELRIRPVLPMVMRGMQVPKRKLLYLLKDAWREARRMDIPFGRISDPVGQATERSLAVFFYAVEEKRERDFVVNVGAAIWSQAIDVATDKGMRKVTEQTGLFWPGVLDAMQDDNWRARAEANRDAMMESGSWGVPTLRIGEFTTWGQDRDWLLVRHLEELCDTGEGILV
jgi:2-hydroxychromene-2-carboxylate isomerase